MSDFYNRVYQVVKQIPPGRITSYGAIAKYLGSPGAARMVGWAMNACRSHHEFIPAHRVLNRNGLLTGKHHFDNPNAMKQMLEAEGLKLDGDQVANFKEKFWDPKKELPDSLLSI